ncbi:MAG: glutamate-5-semialdehyde dehydrogenase [Lactobacillus equicursoris]|uniref:glutamate-5-semialdehyde dehydrogenase n=1 Tax=Lactobacillus equicursoris TaxID=420645 RepID=UPI002432303B|nr:glutamate-5-semialdehyde dehydrogenase [Lactobacillus equicursoris]MDD6406609.1 glutamate-5-semialdehyde dehydrogenase [Lactobacillus equicursoris]
MEESSTQRLMDSLLDHKQEVNLATTQEKNAALAAMADALLASKDEILKANELDLEKAKGTISDVMLDRLRLTDERLTGMANGIRALIDLPDPVGRVLDKHVADNGLVIEKKSVPFGLLGMIYESRPNVTSDVAALAIKSGNAALLRSGKEAFNSANAIMTALKKGLEKSTISPKTIELVQDTTRKSSSEMMTARGKIDLLIPRGGKGLIRAVVDNATVPVIETGTGICHIYVNKAANLDEAVRITANAKMSRPSVCNAAEVCLVDKEVAADFLPKLAEAFAGKVEMRADERAKEYLPDAKLAGPDDFDTEFLDYIMAIKVVDGLEAAIKHIAKHSTHHSEAIITEDQAAADRFTQAVDSAAVYVNASTRFTDGGEFGLGCEIGISTQKMHARGPMGLNELNTYKYIIHGDGQIRE